MHIRDPCRDALAVPLRARRVPRPVKVEAQDAEARPCQHLGEMAERAVRPYVVVADGIAEEHAAIAWCSLRRVVPAKKRALRRAEVNGATAEGRCVQGGWLRGRV